MTLGVDTSDCTPNNEATVEKASDIAEAVMLSVNASDRILRNEAAVEKSLKELEIAGSGVEKSKPTLKNEAMAEKALQDPEAAASSDREGGPEEVPFYETITPKQLSLLSTAFTIATFMIAIDSSILSTAIPRITSDFHRIDDVSWYGSAYLLTEMSFQPIFGRIYKLFDARITYLVSLVIFAVGSIVCAAAPNSIALITGRAIAGAGAAGELCGSLAIFGRSVPLRKRPLGMAMITSMYGIAGILGPTVGGVITDTHQLTWRFCFWMNLPACAVTFGIAFWSFKTKPPLYGDLPLWEKIKRMDLLGGFLLTAGLVALFIALQWGGTKYLWSNPKVYGCLVTFGVLTVGFVVLQIVEKEDATIPMRILLQRTVAISCTFNFIMAMAANTHQYYLAFYFQAVLGTNAAISGVRNLAYGMLGSLAIIITGASITSKGHYVPFMWLGTAIFVAGSVLLRTITITSSTAEWVVYQMITGFGLGLAEQVPFIAVQVVLPDEDMPIACMMVVFSRCFGGAVGLSIAENIFSGALLPKLKAIQGVDVQAILSAGISDLRTAVPARLLRTVRVAFNSAIVTTFILPIAVAAAALLLSFGMERKVIEDVKPASSSSSGEENGERADVTE